MPQYALTFPSGTVEYHLDANINTLQQLAPPSSSIIITDENVWQAHESRFAGYRSIVIPAGEDAKTWQTVEHLANECMALEAHRGTMLVGLGGGTITDLVGFLASVYMRGVQFGFVPTTLLCAVDASIGGKNGINLGVHKNMLGTIKQPKFILHDASLFDTLPDVEWSNGFAEIIKYGCIADARILTTLAQSDLAYFRKYRDKLAELIAGCVDVKNKIVHADEEEEGLRKILNFGHTAGHAFELVAGLPHGQAVGLGMLVACSVSEKVAGLDPTFRGQIVGTLSQYGLPTSLDFDIEAACSLLRTDKKRTESAIDYVVLEKPGVGRTEPLPFPAVEEALRAFANEGHS
jgi:3-dehydroquinate synthase